MSTTRSVSFGAKVKSAPVGGKESKPLTEIRIYYEGHSSLKPGFHKFFAELTKHAKRRRCVFRLISSGSGSNACRDFGLALRNNTGAWNILLRDSEVPGTVDLSTLLCHEYGWDQSHRDSIFWMVEMMESWFHADKEALEKFYGPGFNKKPLKPNRKVEEISKEDLKNGLSNATRDTTKGDYFDHKTSHGTQLLTLIDAKLVQAAAPNCKRLFDTVLERLR